MIGLKSYNTFGTEITINGYFYKGNRKYYTFSCSVCDKNPEMYYEVFTCRIDHFKKGKVGCGCNPYYRRSDQGELLQLNNIMKNSGIYNKVFTKVNNSGRIKYYEYFCSICSEDSELFPKLEMLKGEIKKFQFPCGCGNRVNWTQEQYKILVDRFCIKNNYKLVNFNNATLHGDKITLLNRENDILWDVSLRDLLQGKQDSSKSSSGFNTSKPAHLYIVRWYGFGESYIKFGITNKSVQTRIKQQSRSAKLDYEILHTFHNESGQSIWDCEKVIKKSMQTRECPKELLPDGYTETVLDTDANFNTILEMIEYNLK